MKFYILNRCILLYVNISQIKQFKNCFQTIFAIHFVTFGFSLKIDVIEKIGYLNFGFKQCFLWSLLLEFHIRRRGNHSLKTWCELSLIKSLLSSLILVFSFGNRHDNSYHRRLMGRLQSRQSTQHRDSTEGSFPFSFPSLFSTKPSSCCLCNMCSINPCLN